MKINTIITAGGNSSRYGNSNKLLEKINGQEVINYTLEAFLQVEEIDEIVICTHISIIKNLQDLFKNKSKIKIIKGGKTRQESVYKGLIKCNTCDFVLIHDGARPMISPEIIRKTIRLVKDKNALTVAVKSIDTVKQVDKNLKIIKTIDRSSLFNTQTPQAFEYKLIKEAHVKLQGRNFTDDCSMLEALGSSVYILEGDYKNIKITTQSDIEIAKTYLK